MTKTDALVEELRFLSEWLADAKGSLTPDYGEVAGNNFQMMTMCPDPERLARAINALPAALAALAPELVDGVMEVRRLLEEARAIIAGGPENGILPTVASIDLAISKALASLTRAPTSEPDEAEVERVAEWRTIDSAPKDGTVILTVCTYDNPPTASPQRGWQSWRRFSQNGTCIDDRPNRRHGMGGVHDRPYWRRLHR